MKHRLLGMSMEAIGATLFLVWLAFLAWMHHFFTMQATPRSLLIDAAPVVLGSLLVAVGLRLARARRAAD